VNSGRPHPCCVSFHGGWSMPEGFELRYEACPFLSSRSFFLFRTSNDDANSMILFNGICRKESLLLPCPISVQFILLIDAYLSSSRILVRGMCWLILSFPTILFSTAPSLSIWMTRCRFFSTVVYHFGSLLFIFTCRKIYVVRIFVRL